MFNQLFTRIFGCEQRKREIPRDRAVRNDRTNAIWMNNGQGRNKVCAAVCVAPVCVFVRALAQLCAPALMLIKAKPSAARSRGFIVIRNGPASARHKWSLNESVIYSKLWYVRFDGSFWAGQRGRRCATGCGSMRKHLYLKRHCYCVQSTLICYIMDGWMFVIDCVCHWPWSAKKFHNKRNE